MKSNAKEPPKKKVVVKKRQYRVTSTPVRRSGRNKIPPDQQTNPALALLSETADNSPDKNPQSPTQNSYKTPDALSPSSSVSESISVNLIEAKKRARSPVNRKIKKRIISPASDTSSDDINNSPDQIYEKMECASLSSTKRNIQSTEAIGDREDDISFRNEKLDDGLVKAECNATKDVNVLGYSPARSTPRRKKNLPPRFSSSDFQMGLNLTNIGASSRVSQNTDSTRPVFENSHKVDDMLKKSKKNPKCKSKLDSIMKKSMVYVISDSDDINDENPKRKKIVRQYSGPKSKKCAEGNEKVVPRDLQINGNTIPVGNASSFNNVTAGLLNNEAGFETKQKDSYGSCGVENNNVAVPKNVAKCAKEGFDSYGEECQYSDSNDVDEALINNFNAGYCAGYFARNLKLSNSIQPNIPDSLDNGSSTKTFQGCVSVKESLNNMCMAETGSKLFESVSAGKCEQSRDLFPKRVRSRIKQSKSRRNKIKKTDLVKNNEDSAFKINKHQTDFVLTTIDVGTCVTQPSAPESSVQSEHESVQLTKNEFQTKHFVDSKLNLHINVANEYSKSHNNLIDRKEVCLESIKEDVLEQPSLSIGSNKKGDFNDKNRIITTDSLPSETSKLPKKKVSEKNGEIINYIESNEALGEAKIEDNDLPELSSDKDGPIESRGMNTNSQELEHSLKRESSCFKHGVFQSDEEGVSENEIKKNTDRRTSRFSSERNNLKDNVNLEMTDEVDSQDESIYFLNMKTKLNKNRIISDNDDNSRISMKFERNNNDLKKRTSKFKYLRFIKNKTKGCKGLAKFKVSTLGIGETVIESQKNQILANPCNEIKINEVESVSSNIELKDTSSEKKARIHTHRSDEVSVGIPLFEESHKNNCKEESFKECKDSVDTLPLHVEISQPNCLRTDEVVKSVFSEENAYEHHKVERGSKSGKQIKKSKRDKVDKIKKSEKDKLTYTSVSFTSPTAMKSKNDITTAITDVPTSTNSMNLKKDLKTSDSDGCILSNSNKSNSDKKNSCMVGPSSLVPQKSKKDVLTAKHEGGKSSYTKQSEKNLVTPKGDSCTSPSPRISKNEVSTVNNDGFSPPNTKQLKKDLTTVVNDVLTPANNKKSKRKITTDFNTLPNYRNPKKDLTSSNRDCLIPPIDPHNTKASSSKSADLEVLSNKKNIKITEHKEIDFWNVSSKELCPTNSTEIKKKYSEEEAKVEYINELPKSDDEESPPFSPLGDRHPSFSRLEENISPTFSPIEECPSESESSSVIQPLDESDRIDEDIYEYSDINETESFICEDFDKCEEEYYAQEATPPIAKSKKKITPEKKSLETKPVLKANLLKKQKVLEIQKEVNKVINLNKVNSQKTFQSSEPKNKIVTGSKFMGHKFSHNTHGNSEWTEDMGIPFDGEAIYDGEKLGGVFGFSDAYNFYQIIKSHMKNMKNPTSPEELLIKFLRPLCRDMLTTGYCENGSLCKDIHQIRKESYNHLLMDDFLRILEFVLKISVKISESFIMAVFEYFILHKKQTKILMVSSHIITWDIDDTVYFTNVWGNLFNALEACGLERWQAIKAVVDRNYSYISSLSMKKINKLLKIWNLQSSSVINVWNIIEPITNIEGLLLPPQLLTKIISEVLVIQGPDIKTVYKKCAFQLLALSPKHLNEISSRLLQDFLSELRVNRITPECDQLRERISKYNAIPYGNYSPVYYRPENKLNNLRRCKSVDLSAAPNDSPPGSSKVYELEKMKSAIKRALECSNYESVVSTIILASNQFFINDILRDIYDYLILHSNALASLKKILEAFRDVPDSKRYEPLFGSLLVTFVAVCATKVQWDTADKFYSLFDTFGLPKYNVNPLLGDGEFSPVKLAVLYSEVHFYNQRYKDAIGELISNKLINPLDEWLLPSESQQDLELIKMLVKTLMRGFLQYRITEFAIMLFIRILDVQHRFNSPIDLGVYFEPLLYNLFEIVKTNPESALKLYNRVNRKQKHVPLSGLTIRALLIIAYKVNKTTTVSELFLRALEECAYPILEERERTIMLLRSMTEDEMYVYITEWLHWFRRELSKHNIGTAAHEVTIQFKSTDIEDFLDNKELGIPAVLLELDQSLCGAMKRLDYVIKKCHLDLVKNDIEARVATLEDRLMDITKSLLCELKSFRRDINKIKKDYISITLNV